ncbi:MAG: sulfatase [Bacteroidales bacterium]|nr:sulfatase [Bacteroidales bacterium]
MRNLYLILIVFTLFSCKKQQPNVIFLLTDQWRASALGYNGDEIVQTPRLDEFSKSSVNFNNAVSVLPVCTPYRASLMTGRFPTSTGMFINDLYLPSEELCIAEIYNDAGYNTAYLGKWHLDGHGRRKNVASERRQGWTYWKGSECDHQYLREHYFDNDDARKKHWKGYSTYAIANEAKSYMAKYSQKQNPFFLFVSIGTPHFPHHTAPKEYMEMYFPEKLKLPPNVPEKQREKALKELQGYYAHCTATDKAIGEIIDATKELKIYDNTIIVFTSDHGEMMGAHNFCPYMKHQPYSESANVPFLISYPNIGDNAGKTANAAITTPDILPSLLAMCDVDIPSTIEGYDLSEIITQPELAPQRAALYMNVSPFGIAFPSDEYRAVRTADYTYVKNHTGALMLFDNHKDPYQMNNLINNSNYVQIEEKLDKQLMTELERIGEADIKPREYYLKKFGYWGQPQFEKNYHIGNSQNVTTVISPNNTFEIKN